MKAGSGISKSNRNTSSIFSLAIIFGAAGLTVASVLPGGLDGGGGFIIGFLVGFIFLTIIYLLPVNIEDQSDARRDSRSEPERQAFDFRLIEHKNRLAIMSLEMIFKTIYEISRMDPQLAEEVKASASLKIRDALHSFIDSIITEGIEGQISSTLRKSRHNSSWK